ncbi:MAG: adenylate/guanylate cyclase domain-containing protein, partial [Myxococcota bacterium]
MARSENLTIMFTDIVGFTAKTSNQSRAENAAMLKEHDRLLLPIVANYGGRRVKSIGDAMLVTFRSPTDAVRCGMGLQDSIAERNRSAPGQDALQIRVAIALGDVRIEAGDVFGEPVNIAARIESMTPPDEVYLGQSVYLAMNRAEVTTEFVGERTLKGIPEPVHVYRVLPLDEEVSTPGDIAYFPFGGMHRSRSESSTLVARTVSSATASVGRVGDTIASRGGSVVSEILAVLKSKPQGVLVAAACGSLLVAAFLVLAFSGNSALDDTQPFVDAGEWDVIDSMAQKLARESPQAAEVELLMGHAACGRKARKRCLEHYRTAFERDSDLRDDTTTVDNIVQSLGWEAELAGSLLREFPSSRARDALLLRTTRAGYWGRRRAVETLDAVGEGEQIDRGAVALSDLEEAPSCEKRLEAVKVL